MALYKINHVPDLGFFKRRIALSDRGFDLASGALAIVAQSLAPDNCEEVGIRHHVRPHDDPYCPRDTMYVAYSRSSAFQSHLPSILSPVDTYYSLSALKKPEIIKSEKVWIFLIRWKDELVPNPQIAASYSSVTPEQPEIKAEDHTGFLDWVMNQALHETVIDFMARRRPNTDNLLDALATEIQTLGPVASDFSPDSPRSGSIEELWRYRDQVVGRHMKMLEEKLELITSGNTFEFLTRVCAVDEAEGWLVANGVAKLIGTSGTTEIIPLEPGSGENAVARDCVDQFRFHPDDFYPLSRALAGPVFQLVKNDKASRAKRIKQLSRCSVLCSVDDIENILRLPVSKGQKPKTMFLETEMGRFGPVKDDGVLIGIDLERNWEVRLPTALLGRHLSVFGSPGTGKTTTILRIAAELNHHFLIIEPRKGEYRRLMRLDRLARVLQIFTPGNERSVPLRFNPLEVPDSITVGEHAAAVCDAFLSSLPTGGPIGPILRELVEEVYRAGGLDSEMYGSECKRFPTLYDLERAIPEVMGRKRYSKETRDDVHGALETRIGSLTRGQTGKIFDCERSLPRLSSYINMRMILELQGLSGETRSLFALLLMTSVEGYLRGIGPSNDLRSLMIIEEAHNMLGGNGRYQSAEEGDPQGSATDLIIRMLAELRAYGLGICVVDQTPAAISALVRKNTAIKISHRPTDAEDADILTADLNLPEWQATELQRLDRGEAFVYHEKTYNAIRTRIDGLPELRDDLSEEELKEALRKSAWYAPHLVETAKSDLGMTTRRFEAKVRRLVRDSSTGIDEATMHALQEMKKTGDRLIGLGAPAKAVNEVFEFHKEKIRNLLESISGASEAGGNV